MASWDERHTPNGTVASQSHTNRTNGWRYFGTSTPTAETERMERSLSPRFPTEMEMKTRRSLSNPQLKLPHPSAFLSTQGTSAAVYHPTQTYLESESQHNNSGLGTKDQNNFYFEKGRRRSIPLAFDPSGSFRYQNGRDPTRPPDFTQETPSMASRGELLPELANVQPTKTVLMGGQSEPDASRQVENKSPSRRSSNTPAVQVSSGATKSVPSKTAKTGIRRREPLTIESGISSDSESDSASVKLEPDPDYTTQADKKQAKDEGEKDRDDAEDKEREDAKNKEKEDAKNKDEDLTWRPYDNFGTYEWEFDDEKTFQEILKVIRCSLYGFLILALLLGTVASRIALFLLASDIHQSKEARGESIAQLIICLCTPIVFNWIQAAMRILFGGTEWPTMKMFMLNVTFELLTTFGMCLLVFRVIPSTDFFSGMVVTFNIFQFPSIFKLLSKSFGRKCNWKQPVKTMCLVLAMAIQLGFPAYFLVRTFSSFTITQDEDHSMETPVSVTLLKDLGWELPVALWLVSLSWWENYFPLSEKSRPLLRRLQETRDTCYVLSSPIKVGLILLVARYLPDQQFSLNGWEPSDGMSQIEFYAIHYSLLCIILGSSILCTYLGGLACKLHMQKAAFAFPLLLSPPASLAVVYLQCRYQFLPDTWHIGTWYCPNLEWENLREPIVIGVILWLSYCVTVSQIWFPKVERMAKAVRLFLPSTLNSTFPDINLAVRRREDRGSKSASSVRRKLHETTENDNVKTDERKSTMPDDTDVPFIYVCATMWHETKREMTQLLKSLFRLNYNNFASNYSQARFHIRNPDHFNMEIHIFFDDAFEKVKNKAQFVPNEWVRQFIDCMEDAARSVYKGQYPVPDPIKVDTPYGGRLVWTMTGQNKLIVHLKDKNKIRHRKRWSQVMYMYYLLGFKMLGHGDGSDIQEEDQQHSPNSSALRQRKRKHGEKYRRKKMPLRQMMMRLNKQEYDRLVDNSENTFILTLDGDIDFKPKAVELLLDRMKKDRKVAAVCGRIHPIGSGPMVWFQEFEYAVSHWLQKAAEHVFGCVLCCPGCFSLFRASALMDDNVVKTYTTKPTEARHYIQFEQGEDRWLCTLLLQQGYRIDYSACADAYTYAPESFAEFFNQRRRWSPSTMANILDLLSSWRTTIRLNDNISRLFMLYQAVILLSTIISPSFLILMMTYSFQTVLNLERSWAYVLAVAPVALYIFVCLTKKNATQIKVGAVLAAFYAVVMMVITVSTIISIVEDNFGSPNVVFIALLTFIFITAGFLHPQEFFCLLPGVLYFLTIPTSFLLLTIFYLCNLNNVTWGTREVASKNPEEQKEKEQRRAEQKKKNYNIFSATGLKNIVDEIRDLVHTVWGLKKGLEEQKQESGLPGSKTIAESEASQPTTEKTPNQPPGNETKQKDENWLDLPTTGKGPVETLEESETEFWNFMLKKYLFPLDLNKADQENLSHNLRELRNNIVFICIMINLLWTVIALQLQASEDRLKAIYIAGRYEPIAVVFLTVFALILLLQFFGMIIHSWGTFLHFMSTTHINWFSNAHSTDEFARYVVGQVAKNQSLEPPEDYDDDDNENDDDEDGDNSCDDESFNQTQQTDLNYDTGSNQNAGVASSQSRRTNTSYDIGYYQGHRVRRSSKAGHFPQLDYIIDRRLRNGILKSDRGRQLYRQNSSESNKPVTSEETGFSKRPAWGFGGQRHPDNHPQHWPRRRHHDGNATMKVRFQQLLRESPYFGHQTIEEDDGELRSVNTQR